MSDPFATQGAFSWVELTTSDVGAAKKFYRDLFGWELQDMPMPDGTYTVLNVGGQGVGGMMARPASMPAEAPPTWTAYVTVDDVDATAKKVSALGGTVLVPPTDIPNVGRFAWFSDPQGAVLAAITYSRR